MIFFLYVEEGVAGHSRAEEIRARLPNAFEVSCARYGEIFNPKAQSFRLQKRRPALILAGKRSGFVREAPPDYGIGGAHNYVFSPLLNCLYDCRYCYLRGQHRSANYLLFVNYEDYAAALVERARAHPGEDVYFFSGFDADSLALEALSGMGAFFLPALAELDNAWLELRTKSDRVDLLMGREPLARVVVAFTFTPPTVAEALERRAPANAQRLAALRELAARGWRVGLRFDPLIYHPGFEQSYAELFADIFAGLDPRRLHSVTLGPLRFPKEVFDRAVKLYPDDPLLAGPLVATDGVVSYSETIRSELVGRCREALAGWVPAEKVFLGGRF